MISDASVVINRKTLNVTRKKEKTLMCVYINDNEMFYSLDSSSSSSSSSSSTTSFDSSSPPAPTSLPTKIYFIDFYTPV
jgi:hypothetical protein